MDLTWDFIDQQQVEDERRRRDGASVPVYCDAPSCHLVAVLGLGASDLSTFLTQREQHHDPHALCAFHYSSHYYTYTTLYKRLEEAIQW